MTTVDVKPITTLQDLKQYPQWVCYNAEKEPYHPSGTPAKANDPATWSAFRDAVRAWKQSPGTYAGVGFELKKEQNLTVVDLDKCIDDNGQISPFAQRIINLLNSYTEHSPSIRGFHIWVRGSIPKNIPQDPDIPFKIEMYDCKHYFTVTGNHLDGTPDTFEDRQEELLALHQEVNEQRRLAKEAKQQARRLPEQKVTRTIIGGDTPYGLAALERECQDVATTGEGARNHRLNTAAFVLGQLVGGHELTRSTVERELTAAADRCGLGESEIEKTLRSGLEDGMKYPRSAPPSADSADVPTEEEGNATEKPSKDKKGPTTQELLRQIAEGAKYIVTPGGDLYARVLVNSPVNSHHEVVPINERGSGFRRWLVYQFDKQYGHAPNSEAISQVMSSIQAKAAYEGKTAKVHTRIAEHEGNIYLDLANDQWQCVKITPDGWEIITNPPVFFRRPAGMLALPVPRKNGKLDDLEEIINVKDKKSYILMISWLIGALHPRGPYAVLNLNGERGSAKSKTTAILRNLIDPNEAPLRDMPRDNRDMAIAAQNAMVIALDNLSSLKREFSDALCRLATGSGSAYRANYTDDGEKIFSATRPVIINGIEDSLISQGDLAQRTLLVSLNPPEKYKTEQEIDELFRQKHPGILGGLLTLVSVALREHKTTDIEKPPRMADFARWVTAAEKGMNIQEGETFLDVYSENQKDAESIVIESSPLAQAIIRLMEKRADKWEVLISQLHDELMEDSVFKEGKEKLQKRLSGPLKRITPSLRSRGIGISSPIHTKGGSQVTIIKIPQISAGDNNSPKGDDGDNKPTGGDNKKSLSSPNLHHAEKSSEAASSKNGDDGDNKNPLLSASSAQFEQKKRGPDETGKLSSPSSPPTISALLEETRRYLATLPNGEQVFWTDPRQVFSNGYVTADIYVERLQACLTSGEQRQIETAVQVMRHKLSKQEVTR